MKRCNNCGWFNLDSATLCEKCDEDTFESVTDTHGNDSNEESQQISEKTVLAYPDDSVEKQVVPAANKVESSSLKGTVAFKMAEPMHQPEHLSSAPKKVLAATIMDTSSIIASASTIHCHKCNYPISGIVEYCPNCGTTIKRLAPTVKEDPVVETQTYQASKGELNTTVRIDAAKSLQKPEATNSNELKATVRDIPDELISDDREVCRLVPVDEIGEAVIELSNGCEVVIGGHHYRFEK